MVLTPQFEVHQTDELIIIKIILPHIRVSNAELITEGCDFSFYCKPYLLKLSFPCALQEGEDAHRALYDPDLNNCTLTVELKKHTAGEHFEDLDLITKLIKTTKLTNMTPDVHDIEVLHNENFVENHEMDEEENVSGAKLYTTHDVHYGFNAQYSNVFSKLRELTAGVIEVIDPEKVGIVQRYRLRIAQEYCDFDAARFLGDQLDGEDDHIYKQIISFQPFWILAWEKSQNRHKGIDSESGTLPGVVAVTEHDIFDENEQETLRTKLKNKEYLIATGSCHEMQLLCNLIDLLFAYCYDVRLTEGEPNSESPANIARLSRQLTWLDSYFPVTNPLDSSATTIVTDELSRISILMCMRRLLTYSYLRHWKLGRKVLADIARILLLGKRYILKCLLRMFAIFERTDSHYLLNTIYMRDYCVWIQSVSDNSIRQLAKSFNNSKNTFEQLEKGKAGKRWVGFHIVELEEFGNMLLQCDNEEDGINEPDDIPAELLDYSDIFTSADPHLAYLQVACDDPSSQEVCGLGSISKGIDSENDRIGDLESARAQLQTMLLSPSERVEATSKPLIEEINVSTIKSRGEEEEENEDHTAVASRRKAVSPPPLITPQLHPSVADEIQRAMLATLAEHDQEQQGKSSPDEVALEELLLAATKIDQRGLLTAEDVNKLFASSAAANVPPSAPKRVLIQEISSTTICENSLSSSS